MIKQNDPRLKPVIQKMGCFVRSCGAVAEIKAGKTLSFRQINELWDWSKRKGYINKNDDVMRSAPIITKAYEMLGFKGLFLEIATFKDGKMNYYGSISESLKRYPKSYIQKIETDGEIGTHFRVVDFEGVKLFDPYEPDIEPKKILYSIVYAFKEMS